MTHVHLFDAIRLCLTMTLLACSCQSILAQPTKSDPPRADAGDKKSNDPPGKKYRQFDVTYDEKGRYSHRDKLTEKDPQTPMYLGGLIGTAAVRYVVPVRRGMTYTIEMSGLGNQTHVLLTDTDNKEMTHRPGTVVFRASRDGTIFVYATNNARGGDYELVIRGPRNFVKNTAPPAIPPSPPAGGAVTHQSTKFVGHPAGAVWAADGKSFYVLQRTGKLASFSLPGLDKVREVDLGRRFTSISMSSQGLVLSDFGTEVWLVDPSDFAVKKKIAHPNVYLASSSPQSRFAVSASTDHRHSIYVIDLVKGEIVNRLTDRNSLFLTMSPDGKHVYRREGNEFTSALLTEKGELLEEQVSEDILRSVQNICLSPSSDFICVPCMEGNKNAPNHPKIGEHSTYVFGTNNLEKPLFIIASGKYPQSIGLDTKSGYVIAHDKDHQIKLYSFKGELLAEQQFFAKGWNAQKFVVSPQGYDVLGVFPRHVEYIRLPEREKK